MAFIGLHTSKDIELIKIDYKRAGYQEAEDKYEKEINSIMEMNEKIISNHSRKNEMLANDIKDMNSYLLKLSAELKEKDGEVKVLRFFLAAEADKEIKRLEIIAKRTKKARIKKKCESRIISYKIRKIAYEKDIK